jgi:hypothetical protein
VLALEVIVAAAVLVGVAWVVTRDVPGLDEPDRDQPDIGLPAGRLLRSDDVSRLRFRAVSGLRGGVRGYRFDDVDEAMVRVEEALRSAEETRGVAEQQGARAGDDPPAPPTT